jgi:hypothetical protein
VILLLLHARDMAITDADDGEFTMTLPGGNTTNQDPMS